MENPEHEKFLLDIADKVEELVAEPEKRKCFEQYSCDLGKKQAAYSRAKKRAEAQWKIALTKSLPEQTSYLKRKGWNQVKKKIRTSPINIYSSGKNHWKPPEMPLEPLSKFLSVLVYDKDNPDEPPRPKIDEALACYYFTLATIHDKMHNEGYTPIHNDTCAKQLAKSVWPTIENLCVDRQFIINSALEHVEDDLAANKTADDLADGKPANAGQSQRAETPSEIELMEHFTKNSRKRAKNKPETSPAGLLKYLNFVFDDIERLEGSPHVNKYIRTELAIAYHETKKAVEKILAQHPAIEEAPPDSNDPREYMRSVHTWCVGQLSWENGERIGVTLSDADQQTTTSASNLVVEDIDLLLELFRQLKSSFKPKLPSKDKKLWKQCLKKAKDELFKEREGKVERLKAKKSEAAAAGGLGSYISCGTSKTEEERVPEPTETEIRLWAEEKYRQKDTDYQQAIKNADSKRKAIMRGIDHEIYSIRELLLKFSKAKGTLLEADWVKIREDSFVSEDSVNSSIDALEAIRGKIERQKKITPTQKLTKRKKAKEVKKSEKKYQPWVNSGDACFIIENNRIKFHYKNEIKDLKLKSESNTHKLILLIRGGSLRPDEIKDGICPDTTNKASKVVDYANKLLNEKIAAVGFVDIPPNVEFIERDNYGHYFASKKIYEKEEFEGIQLQSN